MPKRIKDNELFVVLDAFNDAAGPLSFEEINAGLHAAIPRRTLQRRLAALVEQGRLEAQGIRKGRRYAMPRADFMVAEDPAPVAPQLSGPQIRLSLGAEDTKRRVTRPQSLRRPAGYDMSFLASYRPNVSAYLPPTLRRKLASLGQTPGRDQPAGTHLRTIMHRLLIDLSWNSSRLEGNTYSLLETQRLLELGEAADGKGAEEAQMILNHKAAIELLADQTGEIGFNRYTVCNLHALLAENLLPNPAAAGRLRTCPVGITGTVFHPLEVPSAIEECFDQILATATAVTDPFEQAFFAMVHIPYLQPFEDVNKRVSRLTANIPLVQRNLGPLSFVDVPQSDYVNAIIGVYELNRVDYLRDVFEWAYERSCARYTAVRQSLGEPDPFWLRHRDQLKEVVGQVVRAAMDKKVATAFVRAQAVQRVPAEDRGRFIEVAENELSSLHEGNFARYRVRPAEFVAWKAGWR